MTVARKTALVTGGAGFIGSHVVDLLVGRGYAVRVIDNMIGGREANIAHHKDNPDFIFAPSDIREYQPVTPCSKASITCSTSPASATSCPSISGRWNTCRRMQGTVRMLECARAAGAPSSSMRRHRPATAGGAPTREDHRSSRNIPMRSANIKASRRRSTGTNVQLPVNSIRIFNATARARAPEVYRPVFGGVPKQKLAGKPFTVVGDGTQTRDFLYVKDIAEAFLRAAETDKTGEVWNLGAGNPQPVNRLVELLGGDVIHIPKRPGEPDCTFADIGKIQRDLGWRPQVSFEDGVARIVAQIDYWRDAPLWEPASIAQATAGWFKALAPRGVGP